MPRTEPDLDELSARKDAIEREIRSRVSARGKARRLGLGCILVGGILAAVLVAIGDELVRWTWLLALALLGLVVAAFGGGLLMHVNFPTDDLHDDRRRLISRLRRRDVP